MRTGNPYFLLWWATVGATLISRSASFGMLGFLWLALLHWLCDFVWLYLLSGLSFKGRKILGKRFQTVVLAVSGVLLLFFSARFMVDAIGELLAQRSVVVSADMMPLVGVAFRLPRPGLR